MRSLFIFIVLSFLGLWEHLSQLVEGYTLLLYSSLESAFLYDEVHVCTVVFRIETVETAAQQGERPQYPQVEGYLDRGVGTGLYRYGSVHRDIGEAGEIPDRIQSRIQGFERDARSCGVLDVEFEHEVGRHAVETETHIVRLQEAVSRNLGIERFPVAGGQHEGREEDQ